MTPPRTFPRSSGLVLGRLPRSTFLSPSRVTSPLVTRCLATLCRCVSYGPHSLSRHTLLTPRKDIPSVASTIAKAAIVVLVTFSIPLQIHPCRASVDAVLKWRPGGAQTPSGPNGRQLLPSSSTDNPRSDSAQPGAMSELRFALITTVILILSYITALSVSSLDIMLAFVGSTGSTSISFILPGLFYYKISDPEGIHQQSLSKESDDLDSVDDDAEDSRLRTSTHSVRSFVSTAASATLPSRLRRAWRWDLEHLDQAILRKMALALAYYGVVVMVVCLIMNFWFSVTH